MGIHGWEWIVIALVAVLLFGAGRLPALGKSLGEGIRNLKRGLSGEEEERKLPAEDAAKDEKKA